MSGKRLHLSVVVSTNLYTTELLSQSGIEPWTVVSADFQTGGRGQRGKFWESEAGMNLTFSILLKPNFKISDQFLISAAMSMAVLDTLDSYDLFAEIKWPNDIIINDHKIAGLLIENQLKNENVEHSIIGLGLNVNQVHFSSFRWPATSVKIELGMQQELDREEVLHLIILNLKMRLNEAQIESAKLIDQLNERIYKRGNLVNIEKEGKVSQGILREVTYDGRLVLSEVEGLKTYSNGEITLRNTFD